VCSLTTNQNSQRTTSRRNPSHVLTVPDPLVHRHREAHLEERPAVVQEAHAGGRPHHQGQRALRLQTALLQTLRETRDSPIDQSQDQLQQGGGV
ncbi:hypothetical protein CRUP_029947, partial [Coryphaenoides rupestris]